ncbi:hypothetical protein EV426DRAFT_571549 [Tirmania nivea]|nr:hypothetical protein EV426DRAFT_571549 [Tirmania nivea]
MYSLKSVVALISGLLIMSQIVAGAAVPPTYGALTCTEVSAIGFPLKKDCEAALAQITPGEPEVCTLQFQTVYDYEPVGTCVIQTYSTQNGRAHCLNGDWIIKGIKKILARCTSEQDYGSSEYTGGEYEWSAKDDEGVRLLAAPIED